MFFTLKCLWNTCINPQKTHFLKLQTTDNQLLYFFQCGFTHKIVGEWLKIKHSFFNKSLAVVLYVTCSFIEIYSLSRGSSPFL